MKKYLLFAYSSFFVLSSGFVAYNPYGYNYVYDNGQLYPVGACISTIDTSDSALDTAFAFECISSTQLRKYYFYDYGYSDCAYGDSPYYTYDYFYYTNNSGLYFDCSGYDSAVLWYNYLYQYGASLYSCPASYVTYYQIASTVPNVCVPKWNATNVYFQWTCSYYLHLKEYSDSSCTVLLSNTTYGMDSCDVSDVTCYSATAYDYMGFKRYYNYYPATTTSSSSSAGTVIAIVVVLFVVLCVTSWAYRYYRQNNSLFGATNTTVNSNTNVNTTVTTNTNVNTVTVTIPPQGQPQYQNTPQYQITPQYQYPPSPQYQQPMYSTPQYNAQYTPQYNVQYNQPVQSQAPSYPSYPGESLQQQPTVYKASDYNPAPSVVDSSSQQQSNNYSSPAPDYNPSYNPNYNSSPQPVYNSSTQPTYPSVQPSYPQPSYNPAANPTPAFYVESTEQVEGS